MKILYVSHNAQFYGAPKSLLEYVVRIKEKGIEPIVVVPNSGRVKSEFDKAGIRTKIIPYQNCTYRGTYDFMNYMTYVSLNYGAVRRISKLIQEEQIDIVHTNTLAVDVGALAAHIAGVPHVWHFREYLKEHFGLNMWNPCLTRKLIQDSRCCIAISKGIQQKYKKKYNADIICLYDGIEKSSYYHQIEQHDYRNENNELLIAGRISEGKGQWDAVRAVGILVARGITVHLNIVGDGEQAFVNELKRYVQGKGLTDYISFRPYTNDLQTMRVQSKIILVCSKMEALGRVTLEAMLAGRIIIGAGSGGTLELIGKNEERGYLYQCGEPEELADKIQYVLTNAEKVLKKEQEAQKYAVELTDLDKYTNRLIQIYRRLLKEND